MPVYHKVYEFDSAIVRLPSTSVVNGLRADDRGNPTYEGVLAEHAAYVGALESAGVSVQVLDPLEEFPDSIFVEDPALVFTSGAILLRPGISAREGETAVIAPVLRDRFERVLELQRGYVDGGDVLTTPELGLKGTIVETPANVLHFKSDCSLVSEDTVISTSRLAASGVFNGFKQIIVPDGEEAAANALRVNNVVFVGTDYPQTIALLQSNGFNVQPLKTSEIAKIDAGLSCMSLRWHK
jgi:dimethylargininase